MKSIVFFNSNNILFFKFINNYINNNENNNIYNIKYIDPGSYSF